MTNELKLESMTIDQLRAEVRTLRNQVAALVRMERLARKHVRDSYIGAAINGLCASWSWEDTKAQRIAEMAERVGAAAMRQRELWEKGLSVNQVSQAELEPIPTGR